MVKPVLAVPATPAVSQSLAPKTDGWKTLAYVVHSFASSCFAPQRWIYKQLIRLATWASPSYAQATINTKNAVTEVRKSVANPPRAQTTGGAIKTPIPTRRLFLELTKEQHREARLQLITGQISLTRYKMILKGQVALVVDPEEVAVEESPAPQAEAPFAYEEIRYGKKDDTFSRSSVQATRSRVIKSEPQLKHEERVRYQNFVRAIGATFVKIQDK